MFSNEFIKVVEYLLPGLVSILVLNILIFRSKQESIILIIEALIFMRVNSYLASLCTFMNEQIALYSISVLIPVGISVLVKYNLINRFILWTRVTNKSNDINTWLEVLKETNYVAIHFKDESILLGYPLSSSVSADEGILYIGNPSWINDKGQQTQINVEGVMVNYKDIAYIYNLPMEK